MRARPRVVFVRESKSRRKSSGGSGVERLPPEDPVPPGSVFVAGDSALGQKPSGSGPQAAKPRSVRMLCV